MYIHGSFINQAGRTISVAILTHSEPLPRMEIGTEAAGIFFTTDPVEITSSVNDLTDPILRASATIRLQTRAFIPDLFCLSALDAAVSISRDGECIFAGFVEPQAYDQDFNSLLDDLDINCIDALSALQYSNYNDIGTPGHPYAGARMNAGTPSFRQLINNTLRTTADLLRTDPSDPAPRIYYDGSRATSSTADPYAMLDAIGASELLFLGEDEDDLWTQEDALEAVVKYLNLHIAQRGRDFYIFSWESIQAGTTIAWKELPDGDALTTPTATVTIATPIAADADTSISIDEVFNQLKLRCNIESVESVIESPLDSSAISSPFSNRQKYCTEYAADGEGKTSYAAFGAMIKGNKVVYDAATKRDWYIQVMDNPNWDFRLNNNGQEVNVREAYMTDNTNQQNLPNDLAKYQGAALISMGSYEHKLDGKDNSPTAKIDMTDYLVVSVNGNGSNDADAYPSEAALLAACPRAVYTGAEGEDEKKPLGIYELLGVAVGCIGMRHEDFCLCTVDEFEGICAAWSEHQERIERQSWERTRILAAICIQPHVKNRIRPERLLPLPWDNATSPRPKHQAEELTPEQRLDRFMKLK